MKFKIAVSLSILLHLSLFALVFVVPNKERAGETTYYVDLIQMSGGSGGGGGGGTPPVVETTPPDTSKTTEKGDASLVEDVAESVKDLTVKKEFEPTLRYSDKENKKKTPKKVEKPEKKSLISVVRKKREPKNTDISKGNQTTSSTNRMTSNVFKTGITSGGSGSGSGTGSGYGSGGGGFGFSSPYSYYFDILRNKISSSWYSSVVSPGLRGKFIVVVNFRIQRNGKMTTLNLEKRSSIESLDQSALRAIENASPFPPLPNDYPERYLIVHFEFIWEK